MAADTKNNFCHFHSLYNEKKVYAVEIFFFYSIQVSQTDAFSYCYIIIWTTSIVFTEMNEEISVMLLQMCNNVNEKLKILMSVCF